jgi:catechol 2,3-dioxygenase-like lactoylglutathione lyase family enzyme
MQDLSVPVHSAVPVIATDDIERSISYYTRVLGFLPDFKYGDPPVYGGVKSGTVEIYFSLDVDLAQVIKEKKLHPEIFVWVTDANNFFDSHVLNGAEIIEPVSDRPWGARQYVVREINGYHLKFAQPLDAEPGD